MNKRVLITGVNGAIGNALARTFKDKGWTVIGVDVLGEGNEHCELFINADISEADSVKRVADALASRYPSLECLINNAALQVAKTLLETTDQEWRDVFKTNVDSIYYTTKYLRGLLKNASIINISSVHSRATSKGMAAYAASKGAVSALTRAMALELAESGIRVNAILPGAIDTPMLDKGLSRSKDPQKAREKLIEATPLKKIGAPEDVAELALFLADGSKSGFITAQEFVCDGGVLARLASE